MLFKKKMQVYCLAPEKEENQEDATVGEESSKSKNIFFLNFHSNLFEYKRNIIIY
jgi:hypothetical protein